MYVPNDLALVARVAAAQGALGIPFNPEARYLHEGLEGPLLLEAVAFWEGRVALAEREAAEELAEALAPMKCGQGTGGGTRRRAKPVEDESYLGGDNNVRQENE